MCHLNYTYFVITGPDLVCNGIWYRDHSVILTDRTSPKARYFGFQLQKNGGKMQNITKPAKPIDGPLVYNLTTQRGNSYNVTITAIGPQNLTSSKNCKGSIKIGKRFFFFLQYKNYVLHRLQNESYLQQ